LVSGTWFGGKSVLAGIVIGAALVVAGLMLVEIGRNGISGSRYVVGSAVVGLAAAGAVVAVAVNFNSDDSDPSQAFLDSGLSLAEVMKASSGLDSLNREPSGPSQSSIARAAPVPSLVDGLKRRLAVEPENGSGWALLAQSYAFVGDAALAEEALRRAVELGLDEEDLRQRVANARRDPHTSLTTDLRR
jgi:hypothetical protein